jgi:hypothetical protein
MFTSPLSLRERVRVRAANGNIFLAYANHSSPHPLPLSQRERGFFGTPCPSSKGRGEFSDRLLLMFSKVMPRQFDVFPTKTGLPLVALVALLI